MPDFLQQYNPHPVVVTLCSSVGNCTAGKLPSPNDPSGLGPSASKSKGKSKRSVVNKSIPLFSGCFETCCQTLRGCTICGITHKTIRGWKGLSSSQEIRRLAKQGKNMEAFFCATVKIWTWSFVTGSLKCMICICQSKESTCRERQSL